MKKSEGNSNHGGPISIAVSAAVLLGAYVGGYFCLSDFQDECGPTVRTFSRNWQTEVFRPALMVEKRVRGDLWVGVPMKNGDTPIHQVD